jgi:hypothetical protein
MYDWSQQSTVSCSMDGWLFACMLAPIVRIRDKARRNKTHMTCPWQTLIAICPFDILFLRTRWWLLKRLGLTVGSPFTPVAFEDSFVADYLTSMVKVGSWLTVMLYPDWSSRARRILIGRAEHDVLAAQSMLYPDWSSRICRIRIGRAVSACYGIEER